MRTSVVAWFHLLSPRWKKSSLAVFVITGLAYAWYAYRFPSWTEVVELPDGRRIEIQERRDVIEGYGTRWTWMTFSLPEMGGKQTWSEALQPTMIGAAEGKVYVVGRPRADKQFKRYVFPKYTYVAFEWRGDEGFVRIPFMQVPEALRQKENVRWCLPGGKDSREAAKTEDTWCVWPGPHGNAVHFPRPQLVDLAVRQREAEFWARLTGHVPSTE